MIDAKGILETLFSGSRVSFSRCRAFGVCSLKLRSALTGESLPSEKDAGALVAESATVEDRLYSVSGLRCYLRPCGYCYRSGMNTEMGKIANLWRVEETKTPLREKLARLGKSLGIIAAACSVIFAIGSITGMRLMEIFMIAVSLAVSAIPEGLPAIVTIVLSIGVQQMVKKNAIIRRLPAVETLGSASVICSDKTGTLTQNRMTLVKAYAEGMTDPEEINTDNSKEIRRLLLFGMLCSDGVVEIE